jgi:hypothetical protein
LGCSAVERKEHQRFPKVYSNIWRTLESVLVKIGFVARQGLRSTRVPCSDYQQDVLTESRLCDKTKENYWDACGNLETHIVLMRHGSFFCLTVLRISQ